jgi:hypothetical protein
MLGPRLLVIVDVIVQHLENAEENAEADNRNQEQALALIHSHQTTVPLGSERVAPSWKVTASPDD